MKSRTKPPIESLDTSYTPNVRAREEKEVTHSQFKISMTPPPWPAELSSDSAVERRLARAEMTLDDVARREQMLSAQVKAHRHCVAELAEERALLEAERRTHAQQVKQAEETLIRMREQLALESQKLEEKRKRDEADQVETAGSRSPQDPQGAVASGTSPASGAGELFCRLAKQAADFAALTETVKEIQGQFSAERTRHEVTARSQMEQLRERESALAQRESEASKRISAATLQLHGDRETLVRAQEEFVVAKRELAESLLKLEQRSSELAKREATLERAGREADELRQQAVGLRNERLALESKVAALDARETALEEKRLAFGECLRKFRETFSDFNEE